MNKKKLINQLNKELNALPVPNVLKAVRENSQINVESVKNVETVKITKTITTAKKQAGLTFSITKFAKVAVAVVVVVGVSLLGLMGNLFSTTSNNVVVTIDINPSISLTIDEDEKVKSVSAINTDASDLLSDLSLNNKTLTQAINLILTKAVELNKIDIMATESIDNAIMFSVNNNSNDIKNSFQNKMQNAINNYLTSNSINCNVIYEEYDETIQNQLDEFINDGNNNINISPAKYNYIKQLIAHHPALAGQEQRLATMSVAELYKLLNDYISFNDDNDLLDDIIDGIIGNNGNINQNINSAYAY